MERTPGLVSIVIPAYNADLYLAETLDHVARQTYVQWELIVVDDASIDCTEQIVREFARRNLNNRVELLRNGINQGPSISRNVALTASHGEYIALLDADDIWRPHHLQLCVQALERNNSDIAYSKVLLFDGEIERVIGTWGPDERELARFPIGLFGKTYITPSSTVMKWKIVESVGGFVAELHPCEDLDYWLRCVKAGSRFLCIPGNSCYYRKGQPHSASSKKDRVRLARVAVLEKHLGMSGIPISHQYRKIGFCSLRAATRLLRTNPAAGSALFLKSCWYLILCVGAAVGIVAETRQPGLAERDL